MTLKVRFVDTFANATAHTNTCTQIAIDVTETATGNYVRVLGRNNGVYMSLSAQRKVTNVAYKRLSGVCVRIVCVCVCVCGHCERICVCWLYPVVFLFPAFRLIRLSGAVAEGTGTEFN